VSALDGARLKLARAHHHLEELDQQVVAFLEAQPPPVELTAESGALGDRRFSRLRVGAVRQPPAELGVIVGDIAHNARSALDYVVYELARHETSQDDPNNTQFPIVRDRAQYAPVARRLLGQLAAWQQEVIERLQPFQRDPDARQHPLAVLNWISNRDKHRLLHTTVAQISGTQARLYGTGVQALYDLRQHIGPLANGTEVLYAEFTADSNDVNVQGDLEIGVGLEEFGDVKAVLLDSLDYAEAIIDWFDPVFA